MECKCGNKLTDDVVDIVRKSDGKVAEDVNVQICDVCDYCYVNLEVLTFE